MANAVAWSPVGGAIKISAIAEDDSQVGFQVEDNGPGMTKAEIDTALKPFRQLDMSLARRVGGLGLGLTLAQRMAKLLGGYLRIESEPGKGTKAAVILPRIARVGSEA